MKTTVYHHNDSDGYMSALIVKQHRPDAKFIEVNYGYKPDVNDIKDNEVIIVDFSFNYEDMIYIKNNSADMIWIDHHKTIFDKMPTLANDNILKGKRDTTKSACMLTWEHFNSEEEVPLSVKLIDDYDMWRHEYPETRLFNEIFNLEMKNLLSGVNKSIIFDDNEIDDYIEDGRILVKQVMKHVRQSYNEGTTNVLMVPHRDNDVLTGSMYENVRWINSNINISDIGNYACDEMKHDIAVIWSVRNDEIIVSLRSKIVDVSKIAMRFGGGGHSASSGFKLKHISELTRLGL